MPKLPKRAALIAAGVAGVALLAVLVARNQRQKVALSRVAQEDDIDTTGPTPTPPAAGEAQQRAQTLAEYLNRIGWSPS